MGQSASSDKASTGDEKGTPPADSFRSGGWHPIKTGQDPADSAIIVTEYQWRRSDGSPSDHKHSLTVLSSAAPDHSKIPGAPRLVDDLSPSAHRLDLRKHAPAEEVIAAADKELAQLESDIQRTKATLAVIQQLVCTQDATID